MCDKGYILNNKGRCSKNYNDSSSSCLFYNSDTSSCDICASGYYQNTSLLCV